MRGAGGRVTNILFTLVYSSFGAGADASSDSRVNIDAGLGARRIRGRSFRRLKTYWATTTRMMKMGEMGRKGGSVTFTASSYSFIYTIFVLGASHMGL